MGKVIQDDERQTETHFHLRLPLRNDRCRTRDNNAFHFLAHDQLAEDQPGFDRFPETNIVSDEQIDSREM